MESFSYRFQINSLKNEEAFKRKNNVYKKCISKSHFYSGKEQTTNEINVLIVNKVTLSSLDFSYCIFVQRNSHK